LHDEELELVQKKESLQSELNVIEERKNNRNLRSEKLDEDISYQLDRLGNLQDRLKQREQIKDENKKLQFIAPDYLLDEVYEHLPKIMEKNHLTKRQANAMLKEFIKNITF